MNTDNNLGGVDWSQFTFPGLQDPEVSLSELETGTAEELFRSTVGSSGTPLPTEHNGAGNPVLIPPDFTLFPPSRNQLFSPDNLTKDALIKELKGFPQYQTFMSSQSVVTQDDVISHIREIISQNINTPYSLDALVGKGLADEMNLVLQAHPNPALESTWMDLRATLLVQNHPLANALIEAEKSELIQQGVDPLKAATLANAAIVTQLDQALSENGVVTPYYGLHPKMEAILDKAILTKLQGNPMAERFLGDLKGAVAGRGAFLGMLGRMEGATPAPGTAKPNPTEATLNTIAYAEQQQDVVNRAIELLSKVALPEGQREALLTFMTKISEALSILKKLAAELNVDDLKAKLSKSQSDIKNAVAKLKHYEALINKALEKLDAALKLMETMKTVQLVLTIVSSVMMGLIILIMIVIFVVIAVIALVIMAVILAVFLVMSAVAAFFLVFGTVTVTIMIAEIVIMVIAELIVFLVATFILLVVTIVAVLIAAIMVTSLSLTQTGAMDTMMNGLFDFWMLLLNEVCHAHASKETASYIMIGILGALVAIVIVAILLVIIIAIILLILVVVIAVVAIVAVAVIAVVIMAVCIMVGSLIVCIIATVLTVVIAVVAVVVVVVIVVVAVILLVILTVVLFFVCLLVSQFLPELLVRSGLIDKIVDSMGTTFGMDEEQKNNAQVALRIVFAMGTMMTGQSCSSSFWNLNEEDRKLVNSEGTLRANMGKHEADIKRFAYFAEIYDPSFSKAGAAMGLTNDQIAANAARVAKMVKILQEIIKKLEKLLDAILSGGGTEGADQAASLVGKNSETIESIVDSIQDLINDQLLTYVGPQAVHEQPNLKMPMQMMIEIMALAAARTIPPESYHSAFNKGPTVNNRMEQDIQESLLTTQGIAD